MVRIFFFLLLSTKILFACALCANASIVKSSVDVNVTQDTVHKISITWTFDEALSKQLLAAFDANGNQLFDASEQQQMHDTLMKQTTPPFMTVIALNDVEKKLHSVSNFHAFTKGKNVCYAFDITLNLPLRDVHTFELYFIDQTHALAFVYQDKDVVIHNVSPYNIEHFFRFKIIKKVMANVNSLVIHFTHP